MIGPSPRVQEVALFSRPCDRDDHLANLEVVYGGGAARQIPFVQPNDENVLRREPLRSFKGGELDRRSGRIDLYRGRRCLGRLLISRRLSKNPIAIFRWDDLNQEKPIGNRDTDRFGVEGRVIDLKENSPAEVRVTLGAKDGKPLLAPDRDRFAGASPPHW